jgi:hypothetical protein
MRRNNLNSTTLDTQTLGDGESMAIELHIRDGQRVVTFVDDGSGEAPATYDLAQEHRPEESGPWMQYDAVTNGSARSHVHDAVPQYWRAVLTNQSGEEATFRVRLVSHGADH